MSTLKRRLSKLEGASSALSGIYSIEIGYAENKDDQAVMEEEAYEELERRCNGSVKGIVCFITNYQSGFRWRINEVRNKT